MRASKQIIIIIIIIIIIKNKFYPVTWREGTDEWKSYVSTLFFNVGECSTPRSGRFILGNEQLPIVQKAGPAL
jgi:hypothetical protein